MPAGRFSKVGLGPFFQTGTTQTTQNYLITLSSLVLCFWKDLQTRRW